MRLSEISRKGKPKGPRLVLKTISERAATAKGASKFVGKAGQVFYIQHHEEGRDVICKAYAAATTPYQPLRELAGRTHVVAVDDAFDKSRNNVRVYPFKSAVQPQWQRYGLMSAMYDHLDQHGFVVYPATGEVGDKALQTQSDDAKAFWAARQARHTESKLTPVSEAEFWGWNTPFGHIHKFGDLPVIGQAEEHGYHYPMLTLWEKPFARGVQKVGVMYDRERGYRVALSVDDPKYGEVVDLPFVREGMDISPYHYPWLGRLVKAATWNMILKINSMIQQQVPVEY